MYRMDGHEELDRLYVVSDLHLGGAPDTRIFRQAPLLAATIRRVAEDEPDARVGLLLNGDIIDLLALPKARAFDPMGAPQKVNEVMDDPELAPVFKELADLLARPRRRLLIGLGNHDVELALPTVQHTIARRLCGDDDAARGRLSWHTDGTGYRCYVGSRTVFALHGDVADPQNRPHFEALRAVIASIHEVAPRLPRLTPSAGSAFVISTINPLKERYPFVDLLKPELGLAIPLLMRLAPEVRLDGQRYLDAAKLKLRELRANLRQAAGSSDFLGGATGSHATRAYPSAAPGRITAAHLTRRIGQGPREEELLGVRDAIWFALGLSGEAALRRSMKEAIEAERPWALDHEHPDGSPLAWLVERGVRCDVAIAGHTHLRKLIPGGQGRPTYVNTGTWAGLMRVRPEELLPVPDDPEATARRFDALCADLARGFDSAHLDLQPTVARVAAEGQHARVSLIQPELTASGELRFPPVCDEVLV